MMLFPEERIRGAAERLGVVLTPGEIVNIQLTLHALHPAEVWSWRHHPDPLRRVAAVCAEEVLR